MEADWLTSFAVFFSEAYGRIDIHYSALGAVGYMSSRR
jgi:hypothetical protein